MDGIKLGVCIVAKTMAEALEPKYDSPSARIQLLAIGMQESKFIDRVQKGNGPAHSFWQEEPNGIKAVLNHYRVGPVLVDKCKLLGVDPNWQTIYREVINNDVLACVVARLLLYADGNPLPKVGDSDDAWKCYIRNWKPGKPRELDWPYNYKLAQEQIDG